MVGRVGPLPQAPMSERSIYLTSLYTTRQHFPSPWPASKHVSTCSQSPAIPTGVQLFSWCSIAPRCDQKIRLETSNTSSTSTTPYAFYSKKSSNPPQPPKKNTQNILKFHLHHLHHHDINLSKPTTAPFQPSLLTASHYHPPQLTTANHRPSTTDHPPPTTTAYHTTRPTTDRHLACTPTIPTRPKNRKRKKQKNAHRHWRTRPNQTKPSPQLPRGT